MIGLDLRLKIAALERGGFADAARHLRRRAAGLGVPLPPRGPDLVELPALDGFSADDLNCLGVPWRRSPDGPLVRVPHAGGGA